MRLPFSPHESGHDRAGWIRLSQVALIDLSQPRESGFEVVSCLRNALTAATAAFDVIKRGSVDAGGRVFRVVDSSLLRMRPLVDHVLVEVRLQAGSPPVLERMRVADLLEQIVGVVQPEAEGGKRRVAKPLGVYAAAVLGALGGGVMTHTVRFEPFTPNLGCYLFSGARQFRNGRPIAEFRRRRNR